MPKPSMMPRMTVASTPPQSRTSSVPNLIERKAYPRASVEEAQPVETTCEGPRRLNCIEISEERVPMVPEAIE